MDFSKRTAARRTLVQALYQWLLTEDKPAEIESQFEEMQDLSKIDMAFFSLVITKVPETFDDLRTKIEPVLTRGFKDVDPVEKAILLMATYELIHCLETPFRVIINEAVNASKRFGSIEGHKLVNSVLDKIAHEVRQDEIDAQKK